jgi:hypothetical protein
MDLIPGIPRPLFWSVLPVIGLPIVGPLFYATWLRRRLFNIGANASACHQHCNLRRDIRPRDLSYYYVHFLDIAEQATGDKLYPPFMIPLLNG